MNNELYHHGIKGQKWGVRNYQYSDGTLTPAGKRRYYSSGNEPKNASYRIKKKTANAVNDIRSKVTGNLYRDITINKNTTFKRIQTSKEFEDHAFYATHKKADQDKYLGLFGDNLIKRANKAAQDAEKKANKTRNEINISNAKKLRDASDNTHIYQLHISTTKKLRIPSDENAANITSHLLKDDNFRKNLTESITDSKSKMLRPQQQILFNQAEKALSKSQKDMTRSDITNVYKAFNLSLTNHNPAEIAAQNEFYAALKKKGYNALIDYNDKQYSSYHAKMPMIVFDMDSVKLDSVVEANPNVMSSLNKKYNRERFVKEIPANTSKLITQLGGTKLDSCKNYVNNKTDEYLSKK